VDARLAIVIPDALEESWAALTGGDEDVASGPVEVTGRGGQLSSRFAVEEIAIACVATALRAKVALRPGRPAAVRLERGHVADVCRSERFFAVDGTAAGAAFAPLSRFWPAADGWVRTHANYPWHRSALLNALGVPDDERVADSVGAAIAQMTGKEFEARVSEAGGVGAAVRSFDEWSRHPQGQAVAGEPLIGCDIIANASPRPEPRRLRVLDLTRVIAGPVCTRLLGALGADVLRVDPPRQRDLAPGSFADTLLAKRSCTLDLTTRSGADRLHALLDDTDILVQGYRPGALDPFGLSAGGIAERHPGTIVVILDAWGHEGPWAGRRGFDSVVQAAAGLAAGESPDGHQPGALPCQLLDHGTGYLAAAAALDGLRRQRRDGGTVIRRVSLARTARWVATTPAGPDPESEPDNRSGRFLVEIKANGHSVVAVAPAGTVAGQQLRWPHAGHGYGADPASWDL
jgi:crotonobetainyl-CoA:carnitine CoA-transferase CaiB-like acyl-CoA transferase